MLDLLKSNISDFRWVKVFEYVTKVLCIQSAGSFELFSIAKTGYQTILISLPSFFNGQIIKYDKYVSSGL